MAFLDNHSCVLHVANLIGKDFFNIGAPPKGRNMEEEEVLDLGQRNDVFNVFNHFNDNCLLVNYFTNNTFWAETLQAWQIDNNIRHNLMTHSSSRYFFSILLT